MFESIKGYKFNRSDILQKHRVSGISGFMRIKNGEDFLERTITSHIDYFDEIVAVFNQCTDNTESILKKLSLKYPKKLKIYHYLDPVFPLGSEKHIMCHPESPLSMANYSNFALSKTRFKTVSKIDDDHIAVEQKLKDITEYIRNKPLKDNLMLCYSGINIAIKQNRLGIPKCDLISGNGDIGFFNVTEDRFFHHDKRFERFKVRGVKKEFYGLTYWHMKYLKKGNGFANYELNKSTNKRFSRKSEKFKASSLITLQELYHELSPDILYKIIALIDPKTHFLAKRNSKIREEIAKKSLETLLDETMPNWHEEIWNSRHIKN